jgi:hypothetical protein
MVTKVNIHIDIYVSLLEDTNVTNLYKLITIKLQSLKFERRK